MENIKKNNLLIRRAKIGDVKKIYKIGLKTRQLKFSDSRHYHFHEESEIKEWIKKSKDNILYVAVLNKKIIAFLYAKIIDNHWCLLDNLAVLKKYRKKGIGTKLLEKFYQDISKKVDYIQILVEINNKKSRKFWHDQGFKERKTFIWADKDL